MSRPLEPNPLPMLPLKLHRRLGPRLEPGLRRPGSQQEPLRLLKIKVVIYQASQAFWRQRQVPVHHLRQLQRHLRVRGGKFTTRSPGG